MTKGKLIAEVKGTKPVLDKGVFVVTSKRDGYYGIHEGEYAFMAIKNDENSYTVHPVKPTINAETEKNELLPKNAKKNNPIIIVEDNEVFFEANTLVDPYNSSYASKVDIGATIEDKILDAFEAYVDDAFKFGNYYTFYFENENKFEAGTVTEEEPALDGEA